MNFILFFARSILLSNSKSNQNENYPAQSTLVQKGSEKMKFTVVASAPVVIKTFEDFDTNV